VQEYINAIAMVLVTSNSSLEGSSGQRLKVIPCCVLCRLAAVSWLPCQQSPALNMQRLERQSVLRVLSPQRWFPVLLKQDLVSDVSTLMRGVAMHNAKLLHQHNSRRMDVHSLQDQQPPAGFYTKIMVSSSFLEPTDNST
jgi:hypothetical protein